MALRKTTALTLALAALLGTACAGDGPNTAAAITPTPATVVDDTGDEAAILAAFGRYQEALRTDDALAAVAVLSEDTIRHYAELRDATLDASPTELERRSMFEILTVLQMRYQYSLAEVEQLDGAGFAVRAHEKGVTGRRTIQTWTAEKVRVNGDSAKIEFKSRSHGPFFVMRREAAGWKLDFFASIEVINEVIEPSASSGDNRLDAALKLLRTSSMGRGVNPGLLTPLRGGTP